MFYKNYLTWFIRKILFMFTMMIFFVSLHVEAMSLEKAQELSNRYTSEQFINKLLTQFTLDDAHSVVVREHFVEHYSNVKFLQKLMTAVEESSAANSNGDRLLAQRLSAGWTYGGLRLLAPEQQLNYFHYMRDLMSVVSPAECRLLITGASSNKLPSNQAIEVKYFNKIKPQVLKNYFAMQRAALDSYVSGKTKNREISDEKLKVVRQSVAQEFYAVLSQHRARDELMPLMKDMSMATDEQVCELGRLTMEVYLRGDSDINELQIQDYLERYTFRE